MAKQTFIYNSTNLVNPNVNNPFTVEKTALIRAAGLTQTVALYMAVGDCPGCAQDILWEPVFSCGEPITISPDNNRIVVAAPGRYSLGDITSPVVLTGNVNITKEEGVYPSQIVNICSIGGSTVTPTVCPPVASGILNSW
jgi:hypothetical protein